MTTKELTHSAIEELSEEQLEEVHRFVTAVRSKPGPEKRTFLSSLLEIQIDAPPDFAENFDLYASGEKRVK